MHEQQDGEALDKYVTLTLDKEYYALNITSVREILELNDITRIPQTPKHMRGIVNVRGQAVPVVDMRVKFGLPEAQTDLFTRVVILELVKEGEQLTVGLIADTVKDVIEIERSQVEAPPKMANSELLHGVARSDGRFVLILDADRLFSDEDPVMEPENMFKGLLDDMQEEAAPVEEFEPLEQAPHYA